MQDRDFKELFLDKIINITCLSLGEPVPSTHANFALRIAAGMEPENTNKLLHMLVKCVQEQNSVPWQEAVEQVLNGKYPQGGKPAIKGNEISSPDSERRKQHSLASKAEDRVEDVEKKLEDQRNEIKTDRKEMGETERRATAEQRTQKEIDDTDKRDRQTVQRSHSRPSSSMKRPSSALRGPPKIKSIEVSASQPDQPTSQQQQRQARPTSARGKTASNASVDPSSAVNNTVQGIVEDTGEEEEDTIIIEKSIPTDVSVRTSHFQATNRQKGQLMENLEHNRDELIGKNALEESLQASESEEGRPQRSSTRTGIILKRRTASRAGKEVSKTQTITAPPGVATREAKTFSEDEFARLRQHVQTITQSTNPIGKIMDYVQEDLEAIHREYEKWKELRSEEESKLQEEQRKTEQQLKTLQSYLIEMDQQISDRIDKTNNLKASILRNDMTFEKLLRAVTSTQ